MRKGDADPPGSLRSHVEYTVKIGDVHLRETSAMAVEVPVRDIVIHQDYSSLGIIENDIALALLEFPVNYSAYIQPVCFPEKAFLVQAGKQCWVTGWGKLHEQGETGRQIPAGKRLPGALGSVYELKGDTGRQFSRKWLRWGGWRRCCQRAIGWCCKFLLVRQDLRAWVTSKEAFSSVVVTCLLF